MITADILLAEPGMALAMRRMQREMNRFGAFAFTGKAL
jgi:hypothetical protein